MPIPLAMCTRLSGGVLRSVKEFHAAVFGAAFICCQKQDDRAFFSLSQRRNSVAVISRADDTPRDRKTDGQVSAGIPRKQKTRKSWQRFLNWLGG
jgi:hypothetical protein